MKRREVQGMKLDSRTVLRGRSVLDEARGHGSRPNAVGSPTVTALLPDLEMECDAAMAVEDG